MLDRHDSDQAGHGALADHRLEVSRHRAGLRVLQGEQPEGLAAQPVHVEQGDGAGDACKFGATAANDEQVPLRIHLHDGA